MSADLRSRHGGSSALYREVVTFELCGKVGPSSASRKELFRRFISDETIVNKSNTKLV